MKIAIISDIHANYFALQEVYKDILRQKVSQIYSLGDIVGVYPQFKDVTDFMIEHNIISVIGNYDKACICDNTETGILYLKKGISQEKKKIYFWSHEHLDNNSKKYLKSLPLKIQLEYEKHKILLVHGSPDSISKYIYPDTSHFYLENLLKSNMCNIIACGHTHIPMVVSTKEGYIVNPGSVGMPKDGSAEASYMIMDLASEEPKFEIRRIPFDYEHLNHIFEEKVLSSI